MTAGVVPEPLLRAEGLVRHFTIRRHLFSRSATVVRAVDGVDLTVREGETLGIVGESGCGKSTLGRLLLRLIEPTAGVVRHEGADLASLDAAGLRARRRALQIIFQDPYSSLNPVMTVGAILAEPLRLHRIATGADAVRTRVAELLGTVGLAPEHARRYPHEFSGGQRQRIGIARALAVEPRLIVCDEAVSALDVSVQAQVVNLLMTLQQRLGLSYVFIAHDLAVVCHIATRVAVMYLGQIVEIGDKRSVFAAPRHPYTQALLDAVPRPDPRATATVAGGLQTVDGRRRILLEGDIPSPSSPPSGCRFHTRCRHARERCRTEEPRLEAAAEGDGDHHAACHFADELVLRSLATVPTRRDPLLARRLERLQQAFIASEPGADPGSGSDPIVDIPGIDPVPPAATETLRP
jgi:oligopeptide/dipeptide ABC transporter ATP-binding protein